MESGAQHSSTKAVHGTIEVPTEQPNATTLASRELFEICNNFSLGEFSKHPTRGNYLLDLTLSNFDGSIRTRVILGITDHIIVLSTLSLPIYIEHVVDRNCYFYKQADWKGLKTNPILLFAIFFVYY